MFALSLIIASRRRNVCCDIVNVAYHTYQGKGWCLVVEVEVRIEAVVVPYEAEYG
jgi:hypothetical protein